MPKNARADFCVIPICSRYFCRLRAGTPISAVIDMGDVRKAEQAQLVTDLPETVDGEPLRLVRAEADVDRATLRRCRNH